MSQVLEERTVGEIVAADWRTAAVFEQFGIDFCCGGRRSVATACHTAGIDPAAVTGALEQLHAIDSSGEVSQWPVARLVDHIVSTHHDYVRGAVPRISSFLAKLVQVHGSRHPELPPPPPPHAARRRTPTRPRAGRRPAAPTCRRSGST